MFQLVSVTVSTCRKEARNERKQFPLGVKSFSIGTKSVPNKFVSTNIGESFQLSKKKLNKRKRFPQTENPSPPYRMKNLFENAFPLDKNTFH